MTKTKTLTNHLKTLPCLSCGQTSNEIVRISPDDPITITNLLNFCSVCHDKVITLGLIKFINKYPVLRYALKHRGWTIDGKKIVRQLLTNEKSKSLIKS